MSYSPLIKRLLPFGMALLFSLKAAAGFFSNYPITNSVGNGDIFLFESWNGTKWLDYTIPFTNLQTAIGVNTNSGGGTNNGNLTNGYISGGVSSNLSIVAGVVNPTNYIANAGGVLSGSINTHTFTSGTSGFFNNFKVGWDIVTLSDNGQYTVENIIDGTHVLVLQSLGKNYTAESCAVYPVGLLYNDINKNQAGWIGNGSSFGMLGNFFGNDSRIEWDNGPNTMSMYMFNNTAGSPAVNADWSLYINSLSNANVVRISAYAGGNSLWIQRDGGVSFKFGLTNFDGPLNIRTTALFPEGMTAGSAASFYGTNSLSPSISVSGSINGYQITASSGNFNNVFPGDEIYFGGGNYLVLGIPNNTTMNLADPLAANYVGTSVTGLKRGGARWYDATPSQSGFLASDGSLGVIQVKARILLESVGTPSQTFQIANNNVNQRMEMGSLTGGGFSQFDIAWAAPFDSMVILGDGEVGLKVGLTNWAGATNIPINSDIKVSGKIIGVGKSNILTGVTYGNIFAGNGNIPTVTPGAASGAGSSVFIDASSHDTSGLISVTGGTGASLGALINLYVTNSWPSITTAKITLTPANPNASSIRYFVNNSGYGFQVLSVDPITNASLYQWFYKMEQ